MIVILAKDGMAVILRRKQSNGLRVHTSNWSHIKTKALNWWKYLGNKGKKPKSKNHASKYVSVIQQSDTKTVFMNRSLSCLNGTGLWQVK